MYISSSNGWYARASLLKYIMYAVSKAWLDAGQEESGSIDYSIWQPYFNMPRVIDFEAISPWLSIYRFLINFLAKFYVELLK